MRSKRNRTTTWLAYRMLVGLMLVLWIGAGKSHAATDASARAAWFDAAIQTVSEHYFDSKFGGHDFKALAAAARPGIVAAKTDKEAYELLDNMLARLDPGTYAVPPDAVVELDDGSPGLHIVGVGMLLGQMDDGQIIIRRVIEDGPADHGGIDGGDRIAAVDGTEVKGQALSQVTDKIKGKAGTTVALTLLSPAGAERTVKLVRAPVEFAGKVRSQHLPGDIGYIWVPNYQAGTEDDVLAQLRKLHGSKGIILDMRESFGSGDDSTALRIAGLFTQQPIGALVLRTGAYWLKPVSTWGPASFFAGLFHPPPTQMDLYTQKPLVVLIDDSSALAILAEGLKSAGRATLVGRPIAHATGAQQQAYDLPDGGRLWVTTGYYVSASGQPLWSGVTPDVAVPYDQTYLDTWAKGIDPDIARAEAVINQKLASAH